MRAPVYAPLDEALEILAPYGPETKGSLSNHGPMAVEAMCAMGRGDAVIDWVTRYREILSPRPTGHSTITGSQWRDALGRVDRIGDWTAFFDNELEEHPWQEVLDRWLERLAPGFAAAAAHGPIRTGHAVRALADSDTPARRRELADALAYWAASFVVLPGRHHHRTRGVAKPSEAIGWVKMLPLLRRRPRVSISGALAQLNRFEPFTHTLGMVDSGGDPSAFIADLTATFTEQFLINARTALSAIVFIHTVTGPSALRPMIPFVRKQTMAQALRYAWQTSAAIYSRYGARPNSAEAPHYPVEGDN
ncbi:MAG TPA: questin oxidase family protein, partial [Candidatus Binataceae bacterium]|nr:questin oxidase family protein [Candidatus Binataceae bacterium]